MNIRPTRLFALAVAFVLVAQGTASAQWRLFHPAGQPGLKQEVDGEKGSVGRSISIFDSNRHAITLVRGEPGQARLVDEPDADDLGVPPTPAEAYTDSPALDAAASPPPAPFAESGAAPAPIPPAFPQACPSGDCYPACDPCCPEFWEHRSGAYVEFLYLTARDADVKFATPVDGLAANAVPIGRIATADPDYDPGFRVGAFFAIDSCSSFTFNYAHWEGETSDAVGLAGGNGFLRAELVHPNTVNVAADSLTARANYDVDFQMADINYKALIWGGCNHSLNYLVGVRYAHLDQDLQALYQITGTTRVDSEIDFDGFGPRLGFEGERLLSRGVFVYTRGSASFLAGRFDADYLQANVFAGRQAETGFEDDRIVPVLEYELGLGWQNECGNIRLLGGYYIAAWYNTLTTPAFVRSVQGNDFHEDDETLTFDGLTARVEYRF